MLMSDSDNSACNMLSSLGSTQFCEQPIVIEKINQFFASVESMITVFAKAHQQTSS